MSTPFVEPTPATLLRQARDRAGISQAELARRAGTSQSAVSAIENGSRLPRLELLAQLLATLHLQLRLELEPLWERVDLQIAEAQGRSIEDVFELAGDLVGDGGFDLLRIAQSLADIDYRFGGLTAAALLGAPVPIERCELLTRSCDKDRVADWLHEQRGKRWCDRLQRFWYDNPDPREPGPLRWRTELGDIGITFVDDLPPAAAIAFKGSNLPVVALPYVETGDAFAARVLDRLRQRIA
jgi:transcriptional regulator with XRE-family HTH domain